SGLVSELAHALGCGRRPQRLPAPGPAGVGFSSRRRHTRFSRDWSSDVCSSDLFLSQKGSDHFIPFLSSILSSQWNGASKSRHNSRSNCCASGFCSRFSSTSEYNKPDFITIQKRLIFTSQSSKTSWIYMNNLTFPVCIV